MRNVNNHIVLLGVAVPLFLGLDALAANPNSKHSWRALGLGCLAGLGYALDQAAGPPLIGAVALVAFRTRSVGSALLFVLGALPWFAIHHIVTYSIGGTIGPYSAVPEYYRWPGSPFDESNLTGVWGNLGVWGTLTYAAEMLLLSKRSFLLNNLPLILVFPAIRVLWRRHREVKEWPELLFAFVWFLATVSIYAVGSTGYGGVCTSIRWFIPLLAAGFYTIAVALRYEPNFIGHSMTLGFWSFLVGGFLWYQGAWLDHSVASLWIVETAGITLWFADRLWRSWRAGSPDPPVRKDFGHGERRS